jgi:membrane-associated phospholipid phosphatase
LAPFLAAGTYAADSDATLAATQSATPVAPTPESTPPPAIDDGRRTLRRLPANVGRGLIGVFDRESLVPFLVGAAATAGVSFADDSVRDSVAEPDSGFGKALEWPGELPASTIPAIALFTAGRFVDNQRFRAMTYDLGEAALVAFVYTGLLKVTVQRERPDASDSHSFPSGHASNAFALAAVTQHHYGWKVGVPMYALAGVVGYSRMVGDKHYLSDVVAGATIGFIAGRAVVRRNDRPLNRPAARAGLTWSVAPIVTRDAKGIHVVVSY